MAVALNRVPVTPPPFSLADVRRAIPAHCFKKSLSRSMGHLAMDVLTCSALFVAATFVSQAPLAMQLVLWPLYWFCQGAFGTGLWVLAHECGHGAFSDYESVNDAVGLIFHSLLLVPYFSWKHSHRRHHQNTGCTARDEVFVPEVKPAGTKVTAYTRSPLWKAVRISTMQLLGWPLYLAFNATGRVYDRWANHFDPSSPIFKGSRERAEVLASDAMLALVLSGLGMIWRAQGFVWLLKMYIIPLLVVNHWLVMITYLQHTHPNLPHYDDKDWDWLRGAMATVDRSYGRVLDHIFHHIADTHVSHHLFSYMPFYHAQEASVAIKKVLGPYYASDSRNVFVALWQEFGRCEFVTPDKPGDMVYWYNS
eukprot:CAMPEP_0119106356 /NCGR_PEP_ID=MMETSP1180-20130426/4067_1 /TAXON_ID=3052 ORGANISM="Chlamydomonas cf sp, Strain CCMP681" /NCGR_SAMPLE_ID=MMETSP1180 /ASSEMBLY_ACC=CAM_ASM_000741 /LENGTH=364 /DNA_ID=CAMNT_0007091673 /DNA_START=27 /DNA_END=1121 /DNA_ORIENTATION=-